MKLLERVDSLLERGANRLELWARDLAAGDGMKRQLAEELQEDAQFLRRLTPTKIAARARGETPPEDLAEPPGTATAVLDEQVATRVQPPPTPTPKRARSPKGGGGPNPLVVIGVAFVAGIALAKVIDWRGHAHPKR
jgi:hypothetical protein